MAIHPDYPGLSAEVVVDGQPLREYVDDELPQPGIVTTYIEVETNADFAVRYTIPKGLNGVCGVRGNLRIDGKNICSRNIVHKQLEKRDVTKCLDSLFLNRGTSSYTQKFRFSQLRIDEDGEDCSDDINRQLDQVGLLTLRLSFIDSIVTRDLPHKARRHLPQTPAPSRQDKLPMLGAVAEKSLKGDARSHQVSLGVPEFRGPCEPSTTENIYCMGEPFAIFHFKYRSLAALKSLHVRPLTPNLPPRMPVERKFCEVRGEDKETVTLAYQGGVAGTQEVKQETKPGIKREAKMVATEVEVEFLSSKRLKCLPTMRDEVIVLD